MKRRSVADKGVFVTVVTISREYEVVATSVTAVSPELMKVTCKFEEGDDYDTIRISLYPDQGFVPQPMCISRDHLPTELRRRIERAAGVLGGLTLDLAVRPDESSGQVFFLGIWIADEKRIVPFTPAN